MNNTTLQSFSIKPEQKAAFFKNTAKLRVKKSDVGRAMIEVFNKACAQGLLKHARNEHEIQDVFFGLMGKGGNNGN